VVELKASCSGITRRYKSTIERRRDQNVQQVAGETEVVMKESEDDV
jgi:hypothetical protein